MQINKIPLFDNIIHEKIFDDFSALYALEVYDYCYILKKFSIKIYDIDGYNRLTNVPNIDNIEESPLSCFIVNDNEDASFANSGIIFNKKLCEQIGLTDKEMFASIAHEIGHIAHFFSIYKDSDTSQSEEIFADRVAQVLGLGSQMISVLQKSINSNRFSQNNSIMRNRQMFLSI